MSRGRTTLAGLGMGLGAAGLAGAVGAASLVADRLRRRADAVLPEYASLIEPADHELVVVADDGVVLHAQVDEPTGDPRTADGRTKPTVVLTHGFCLTSECWVLQRRALRKAGYRVVTWDLRGHGRSGAGARGNYVIDQLGEDLYAVLQAAAPEGDLALGGHSMGGMTTMAMAAAHPELIQERTVAFAAIATSPGGHPIANGAFVAAAGKVLLERLGPRLFGQLVKRPELLTGMLRANRDLQEFLVERYSFASPVPRSVVHLTGKMILGTQLTVMSDFVPTFDTYDKTAALAQFEHVETLVFHGTQDVLTPPSHSKLIVDAIPGAEQVLIRDAGHIIMLEYPDLLNEQLIALLERAVLDRVEHLDPADKPHLTTVVTPVAKARQVREGLRERHHRPRGRSRTPAADPAS